MGYINFSYFSLDRTYFLFNMLSMEELLNGNIFKTKKFILWTFVYAKRLKFEYTFEKPKND